MDDTDAMWEQWYERRESERRRLIAKHGGEFNAADRSCDWGRIDSNRRQQGLSAYHGNEE